MEFNPKSRFPHAMQSVLRERSLTERKGGELSVEKRSIDGSVSGAGAGNGSQLNLST